MTVPLPSILNVGRLELNLSRRELKRAGRGVYLTKLEFDLLEYLIRHPGVVVSHYILRQQLFAERAILDSNALTVHMCALRSKIGRRLIKTVRGCGYLLDVPPK